MSTNLNQNTHGDLQSEPRSLNADVLADVNSIAPVTNRKDTGIQLTLSGFRNKQDGSLRASSSAFSSEIVAVDKTKNYCVSAWMDGFSAAVVCYYNGTTFISSQLHKTSNDAAFYEDEVLVIPTNATHLAFCSYDKKTFVVNTFDYGRAASAEDYRKLKGEVEGLLNTSDWIFKSYLNSNGIVATSSNNNSRVSPFCTVNEGEIYFTNANLGNEYNYLHFFNKEKTPIISLRLGYRDNYNEFTVPKNMNICYVRFGDVWDGKTPVFLYKKYSQTDYLLSQNNRIESLENSHSSSKTLVEAEKKRYIDARTKAIFATDRYIAGGGIPHWYGVEYIEENPNSTATRISDYTSGGIMPLHVANSSIGLPVQKLMRRCILRKNGTVNYYLYPTNSALKADGTPSNLDGTDGDLCVEIPDFWYKIETEKTTYNGKPATLVRAKISQYYIDDSWNFFQKSYTSALEASINWDTNQLCSVVQTTFWDLSTATGYWKNEQVSTFNNAIMVKDYLPNAARYRGAANNNMFDNNYTVADLGLPAYGSNYQIPISGISADTQLKVTKYIKCGFGRPFSPSKDRGRIFLRDSARKNTNRHNIMLYDNHKALYWLYLTEYANRNAQADFTTVRTSEGYTQGGLGYGACTLPFNDFQNFEHHFPGVADSVALAIIPTGTTVRLGNNSGVVPYYIPYYPYGTFTGTNGRWQIAGYKPYILTCNSYRGVEHFFGHTYKITDQINVQMDQLYLKQDANGNPVPEYDDKAAKAIMKYYYTKYASAVGEDNNNFYEKIADFQFDDYCIYYIQNLLLGDEGHIMPIKTNGKKASYYQDIAEFYAMERQQSITGENAYVTWAGRVVSKDLCGPLFSFCKHVGNQYRTSDTTRLDYR